MLTTTTHEIAEGIYRFSTCIPDAAPGGFTFNQFLVGGDEPLLFHCGPRALFGPVSAAVGRVIPLERLRWVTFGHVEADECGSMNDWLAAAPAAQVAFNPLGCDVSVNDMADRPPLAVAEGGLIDTGGHLIRFYATPHVPHGWEAQVIHDETTGTLFCGDLLSQTGNAPALVHDADIVGAALDAESAFRATCLTADTAPTIRRLADLAPRTLAIMHGPAYAGDGAAALAALADGYATLFDASCERDAAR
jgi:flavorubredoxin